MREKRRALHAAVCLLAPLLLATASSASSVTGTRLNRLGQYSRKQIEQTSTPDRAESPPVASLGSYSADGGSPGYIIGRSWNDDQAHINPGRMLGWGGNSPVIHFVYTNQPGCPGADNVDVCARFLHYNYYDPTVPPNGEISSDGFPVQTNPFAVGGMYASADVDETGHMILAGERFNSSEGTAALKRVGVFWDDSGPGTYGLFINDTLPGEDVVAERYKQPEIEYQEYGGNYITHIISVTGYGPINQIDGSATRQLTYWRKVNDGSGPSGTWTSMVFEDTSWCDQYSMGCEHDGGGNVGIAWVRWRDPSGGSDYGSHIYVILSDDAGATWTDKVDIIPWDNDTDSWQPWIECSALMDHQGYFHVVYNASRYSAASHSASGIDPSSLFHWSNRVAGSAAGGTTSLIHVADFEGLAGMCGRAYANVLNLGKGEISECDNRLYAVWVQYGDPDAGDTTDCASGDLQHSLGLAYNGDLYMSVSLTLDGSLWDAARNLTNSKTPNCDTALGNECDDENYPSVTRYGMNNADFGTLYWAAAPEAFTVANALDPTYSDGYYLDVQFVDDLVPGPARFAGGNQVWSYNPLKWFRLPCVPPVIEPRILISQEDFVYPQYWVKSGEEKSFHIEIENIGNDELNITSITATLLGGTPAGAVGIAPLSMAIDAGASDFVEVTLNSGGFINPASGTVPMIAEIALQSNDPRKPTVIFNINTVVADTVVPVVWDTVLTGASTAWRLGLTVGNNGSAGNAGIGRVNMDFVNTGLECDEGNTVYLCDLSPVVMTDVDHYSWQPFGSPAPGGGKESTSLALSASSSGTAFHFQPVPSNVRAEKIHYSGHTTYRSELFVTSDSTIGLRKYWYAPAEDVSYVIERMDVFSHDGATHADVRLGEWIDWDIPSDTGNNNEGGYVSNPGSVDYLWQRGLEYDPGAGCTDNDSRYGASGLLGYHTHSEVASDENVNHTGLYGGFALLDDDIFATGVDDTFMPDSAWALLNRNEMAVNNSRAADQQIWLSFGSYTISDDTLSIWMVHASVYDGDESDLQNVMMDAMDWYLTNDPYYFDTVCCGRYCGGFTGNINCDTLCRMNLLDVTALIDHIYLSRWSLCCEENGDTNGDGDINLQDLTRLIDHIYLSKSPTAPCARKFTPRLNP